MVKTVGNQIPCLVLHVLHVVSEEGGVTGSTLQRSPFHVFLRIPFSTSYLSNAAVIYLTKGGGCKKDGKAPRVSVGVL